MDGATLRAHPVLLAALAATLVLLVLHSIRYWFLTDDAFISFRYARNFAHGAGLVFNPGFERVEGYSNFFWVLVLAAFQLVGIAPHHVANVLSMLATVALWGVVVWFAGRRLPRAGYEWLIIVPVALLAITRSVAVWSTSGLETRWFEALVIGAILRLVIEVECEAEGRPGRMWSPWLFALACWTRPDGLLLSACAFSMAVLYLGVLRRLDVRRFALAWLPFVVLVGGHLLFRRLYYGYWLPNTYYAKVGGRLWWTSGIHYLEAFALEYAVVLWVPLVLAGVVYHVRRKTPFLPLVALAAIACHALYIAAIGGDHFEYRPLDLHFPLAFLLIGDGVRALAGGPKRAAAVVAYLALVAVGLWQLPSRSHQQFPERYLDGFPGRQMDLDEAKSYLDPLKDPIYRIPVLRPVAFEHQRLLRLLTRAFVGLRQEEHRKFLDTVLPDGPRIRRLVEQGLLPRDVYFAISCVGAIPYFADVRTLDRLGLTDATIAHGPFQQKAFMAHDKIATEDYATKRGVDLWAMDVHPMCHVTSNCMLVTIQMGVSTPGRFWGAPVGDGYYLLVEFPQGYAAAHRRMPGLQFMPLDDPRLIDRFLNEAIASLREQLARDPRDYTKRFHLAHLLLINKDFPTAIRMFESMSEERPNDIDLWVNLAIGHEKMNDWISGAAAAQVAFQIAVERRDSVRAVKLKDRVLRYLTEADKLQKSGKPTP